MPCTYDTHDIESQLLKSIDLTNVLRSKHNFHNEHIIQQRNQSVMCSDTLKFENCYESLVI